MKYIRTKDGIYEVKKPYYIDKTNHLCWEVSLLPLVEHDMGEIIKQADTIGELCDEKVGTFEDGRKPYIYKQTSWGDLAKDWTRYHNNVCGAIWTDKGLIYVAKMNEKGELELL